VVGTSASYSVRCELQLCVFILVSVRRLCRTCFFASEVMVDVIKYLIKVLFRLRSRMQVSFSFFDQPHCDKDMLQRHKQRTILSGIVYEI